jgi:tRNA(Ile)-lysidine synthase
LDEWLAAIVDRCEFPSPGGGPVHMAVSGGPDSMALMVLARAAGLEGTAVHADHGLRPGSDGEAAVVAEAASRLGFGFSAVRVEVAPGPDLEARARRARYGALPAGVLTGHTMDDQAETVLLNVLRGSGIDGLAGMRGGGRAGGPAAGGRVMSGPVMGGPVVGGAVVGGPVVGGPVVGGLDVVRPLLGIRRSETMEVCRRAGVTPIVDPTNADPRFRRNRIRHEVLPLLDRVAERDLVPVLARQAALAADDSALLDELASALDPTDVSALRGAPLALVRRALRGWLRSGAGYHPPSGAEIARVMEVVAGRVPACELSGGRRVSRKAGRLRVSDPIDLSAPRSTAADAAEQG